MRYLPQKIEESAGFGHLLRTFLCHKLCAKNGEAIKDDGQKTAQEHEYHTQCSIFREQEGTGNNGQKL